MKILQFPAYVTINNDSEFSRNITGYGYMTLDIASSISQKNIKVDLLTQSCITSGKKYNKINILKRTLWDILFSFNLFDLYNAIRLIISNKIAIKKIPNIILYNISMGYFRKVLMNNYDLVHIHGIGYSTLPIIDICEKKNVKYLVTFHGLNSFSDSVKISKEEKNIEKKFIQNAYKNNIHVSVISQGIRDVVLNYLDVNNSKTFKVINNGSNLYSNNSDCDIRKLYNINENKKIMLCVGNLSERKNQIQIVRSFLLLDDDIKSKLVILFLGNDSMNGKLSKEINRLKLSDKLIICGNVNRENISCYYEQADYNIVASISEGFGLSVIEAFFFGVPTIMFENLDAVVDLYNKDAILLVPDRTDYMLSEKIKDMLFANWDSDLIIEHAKKYSLSSMADNYINYFKEM